MTISMTGYGDATIHDGDTTYVVELRSLNNRYFKASIKLPEYMQYLEPEVEKLLRARLHRGSITYALRVQAGEDDGACHINAPALRSYIKQLLAATGDVGPDRVRIDLASLLELPGICQPREPDDATRERWLRVLHKLTEAAIDKIAQMRRQEGEVLRDDLLGHCDEIERHVAAIAERAPVVVEQYRDRLKSRLETLLAQQEMKLDPDAIVREVAIFAERSDISEELSRLGSHLAQFRDAVAAGRHVGKKLEFIAQEMLREANTIASKANDSQIAIHTVDIKSAIDRLKEQVQNVE